MFVNKEDLIMGLQDLRITNDCAEKVEKLIYSLPTVQIKDINTKCGTCGYFERYNEIRGYCQKKKIYCGKGNYCEAWEEGSK